MLDTRQFFVLITAGFFLCGCANGQDSGEQFALVNGVEIAYRVAGNGEPVLLIHGGGIADAYVRLLKEPALQDYQLIAYHRRGAGHSGDGVGPDPNSLSNEVKDAAALLEFLGHEAAHVVGHSQGGPIALALAIDRPELVHSLILMEPAQLPIDGFGPEDMGESFQARLAERDRSIQRAMAEVHFDELTAAERADGLMKAVIAEDWESRLLPDIPDLMEQALRQALRQGGAGESRDAAAFRSLAQPVRWIWSDMPNFGSDLTYEYYEALIPNFSVSHVSGVGHGLQMLEPQPVAEAISEFLKEHPIE